MDIHKNTSNIQNYMKIPRKYKEIHKNIWEYIKLHKISRNTEKYIENSQKYIQIQGTT